MAREKLLADAKKIIKKICINKSETRRERIGRAQRECVESAISALRASRVDACRFAAFDIRDERENRSVAKPCEDKKKSSYRS
jgi:hypothetical protein